MPNKNLKTQKVKREPSQKRNLDICHLRFKIRLADPSAASNIGTFIATRYEIDTTLGSLLSEVASRFEFWKLNSLTLQCTPFNGASIVGFHGICALPDPEDSTPGSFTDFLNQKDVKFAPLFDMNPLIYTYRPPADGVTKWRYCKDILAQADRLEMFGDLIYGTASTSLSQVLSIVTATVDVSFRFPALDAINAPKPLSPQVGDAEYQVLQKYYDSQRVESFNELPMVIEMKSNGVPLGLRETVSQASTGYHSLRKAR